MATNIITENTTQLSVRDLSDDDKDRIRTLLRRGDAGKIAIRVQSCGYQQVLNTLSKESDQDNEEVWRRTLEFISELPKVEVDERFANFIKEGEAA